MSEKLKLSLGDPGISLEHYVELARGVGKTPLEMAREIALEGYVFFTRRFLQTAVRENEIQTGDFEINLIMETTHSLQGWRMERMGNTEQAEIDRQLSRNWFR